MGELFYEDPGKLDLAGIVERMGTIIGYYRYNKSTHERTKEVWGALEMLLRISEKRWRSWIPILVRQHSPEGFDNKSREYFMMLFQELLQRFADEARGYNPAMKNKLAKAIRRAIDNVAANPYPLICHMLVELGKDKVPDSCKEVLRSE